MQQNAVYFAAKRSAKGQKESQHFITFNAPILIIRCKNQRYIIYPTDKQQNKKQTISNPVSNSTQQECKS